jgi:hypothetical protein
MSVTQESCTQVVEPDGLHFEPESVEGERIVEDADYGGVRVRFRGSLGTVRVTMQLDTRGFYFQSPNTGGSGPAARRTRGVRTTVPMAPDSPMSARFR